MSKYIFSAIWITSSIVEMEVEAENEDEAREKINMGEYDVVDEEYDLLGGNNKLEDLQLVEIDGLSEIKEELEDLKNVSQN